MLLCMAAPENGPPGCSPPGAEPPVELVRQQLGKILGSRRFSRTARHQQFLRFVVEETLEGRSAEIKETSVAIQVFGRKSTYDPAVDSIVRVEARNVRNRLREYYLEEGQDDEVVIELPVGGYVPVFRGRGRALAGPAEPLAQRRYRRLIVSGVIAAEVGLLGLVAWYLANPRPTKNSVAVLPIQNLGGAEIESLCQGFTEDLTTELARLPQLHVTARTSAARFSGKGGDLREIARQLGVRHVLEGSIRKEGGRIRVTAQLIDARSGYHVWSESFDREAADALAAEAEVNRLIVTGVGRKLGIQDLSAASPTHLPPGEARELFWRARYLRRANDVEGWERAAALLGEAVRADPLYAQAWSALASVQSARAFHNMGRFDELAEQTRRAAARALELDARNPEAQLAYAQMEWLQERNWNAAERRFRFTLEQNPSFAPAHGWFATALLARGQFDEALDELARAVSLNPLPYVVSNDEATILYCARRYDKAIARARKTLQVNPRFAFARIIVGACESARGRNAEAIREFRAALEDMRDPVLGRLGHALARSGQRDEAETLLKELEAGATESGSGRVQAAFVRIGLGDAKGALDLLEQAYPNHETDLNYIAVDPIFDTLRGEPRFAALKQKLGL